MYRGSLLARRSDEESAVAVGVGLIGIAADNDYPLLAAMFEKRRRDHRSIGYARGPGSARLR